MIAVRAVVVGLIRKEVGDDLKNEESKVKKCHHQHNSKKKRQ